MVGVVILVVVVLAVAVVAATVLRRRPQEPPTQTTWTVPQQLDLRDFGSPVQPWLVVLFTSDTCDTCEAMTKKVALLASEAVAVNVRSFQSHPDTHKRYRIDAVPTCVIADHDGVVRNSFVGPVSATDLWAAVAELREPGSTPPPEAHVRREPA
jgi:thiol-disulfide isomerase/thioredoxin